MKSNTTSRTPARKGEAQNRRVAQLAAQVAGSLSVVNDAEEEEICQPTSSLVESPTILRCAGCRAKVDGARVLGFVCPRAAELPDVDHVLTPCPVDALEFTMDWSIESEEDAHPFIRYRKFLYPYRLARHMGMSDDAWAAMVRRLDDALIRVDGRGFQETPLHWFERLQCFVKDETNSVGQSHKARHLMGVMLYLQVLCETDASWKADLTKRRLAVASCGNAGLGAAVIAAAADWPIDVFIPPDCGESVMTKLRDLKASVHVCHRDENSRGDPCMDAFRAAVDGGSIPFSVQGNENGLVVEGSCTIAHEVVAQLARRGHTQGVGAMYTQVGGGAFGSGLVHGFRQMQELGVVRRMPQLHTVQTSGGHPLEKAFTRLLSSELSGEKHPVASVRAKAIHRAVQSRKEYMQPWENPHSIAHGILDDETYDWANLCDGMLETGGEALVVDDFRVCQAAEIGREELGINVCHTGAAGLAGLLEQRVKGVKAPKGPVVVVFTGYNRDQVPTWPAEDHH